MRKINKIQKQYNLSIINKNLYNSIRKKFKGSLNMLSEIEEYTVCKYCNRDILLDELLKKHNDYFVFNTKKLVKLTCPHCNQSQLNKFITRKKQSKIKKDHEKIIEMAATNRYKNNSPLYVSNNGIIYHKMYPIQLNKLYNNCILCLDSERINTYQYRYYTFKNMEETMNRAETEEFFKKETNIYTKEQPKELKVFLNISVDGHEYRMTIEEAKKLQEKLNELFPVEYWKHDPNTFREHEYPTFPNIGPCYSDTGTPPIKSPVTTSMGENFSRYY